MPKKKAKPAKKKNKIAGSGLGRTKTKKNNGKKKIT